MARSIAITSFFSRANRVIKTFGKSPIAGAGINSVMGLANHLKGFAIGTAIASLPSMIWSFSNLWQTFTTGFFTLYTFNWNAPDAELDRIVKSQWLAYAGQLGGLVGRSLGYFACGALPTISLFAFDEKMALYVGERVGEEILEELIGEVSFVIRQGLINTRTHLLFNTYKNVRRWLKQDNNFLIDTVLGRDRAAQIKASWGEQGSKPFTLANQVEEVIDTIPSQAWRQFAEEAVEEFIEGCIEIGYVVSASMDQYYIDRKNLQTESIKTVEIRPDRTNDDERLIIAGNESDVKSAITGTIAHHQLIENRDVGQIVGTDVGDYSRTRNLSLRLKLELRSKPTPPYGNLARSGVRRVSITIPYANRAKIDWNTVRFALGGSNGYLWGRFRARAIVAGTSGKENMFVYGATANGAQKRLEALLNLSTAEFEAINITEEVRTGERLRNPRLYKEPTQIYPAYMTVINRERQIALDRGQLSYDGTYRDKKARFEIWRDVPPSNFNQTLAEVLQRSF